MNCEEMGNRDCILLVEGDELHLLLSEFYATHDHGTAQNDTVVTSEWVCEFLYAPGKEADSPHLCAWDLLTSAPAGGTDLFHQTLWRAGQP